MKLQPDREDVPTVGVSRSVVGLAEVAVTNGGSSNRVTCHLLSCHHLAPVVDMQMSTNGRRAPNGDYAKVQKRRCLACAAIDAARPPVRTVLIQRPR